MITPISSVQIRLSPGGWGVDAETSARVDAHWAMLTAKNPHLWNGRVLGTVAPGLPGGLRVEDGVLHGTAREGSFAEFLAWRDWGFPDIGLRNLFGSALVLSGDGALIYGLMGRHTANAGRIYPPGGSLEPADVTADGLVNVVGSIERELHEETGLDADDATVEGMIAVFDGPRISIGRMFRFDAPAAALAEAIRAHNAGVERPEFDEVVVLRSAATLDERSPPYARMAAAHVLSG